MPANNPGTLTPVPVDVANRLNQGAPVEFPLTITPLESATVTYKLFKLCPPFTKVPELLLIATFMLEFMLIIHNIKDFGLSGLSHNDLHLDNIIVDHELLDRLLNNKLLITKYPFRVIDFGLSKKYRDPKTH